ncbi:MAG: hypothetical protein ACREDE_09540 [Thermoplasmata archaeon]
MLRTIVGMLPWREESDKIAAFTIIDDEFGNPAAPVVGDGNTPEPGPVPAPPDSSPTNPPAK